MNSEQNLSELTDEELMEAAKKMKLSTITHATLIGIMVGVIIYSAAKNSLGFLTLIPLFLAYKVFHNPENNKRNEELKRILKARNLK
ncbi:MAG: FUSC family protein [Saprospiraceae bacterium]|jgi:cadmium resistance protein CadD (predicted permease)|nr:FUSC family protein [Lewinellaceae bacterium]